MAHKDDEPGSQSAKKAYGDSMPWLQNNHQDEGDSPESDEAQQSDSGPEGEEDASGANADGPDQNDRIGRDSTDAEEQEADRLRMFNAGGGADSLYRPQKGGDNPDKGLAKTGLKGKLGGFAKKHSKKLWLGGAVIGSLFFGFMLILFLLGSLLLPHFFQNIVAYRFANAARSYRIANEQVTSAKVVVDSADDTKFNRLKAKYGKLKSWALLEKYRPAAIAHNMEATGKLDFEYAPRKNILSRPKLSAIIVNGERIPIEAQSKWGIPFSRAGDNIRLATAVDDALFKEMRGTNVAAQVLRTSVGAKILERIGYRGFYAWASKAKDYKNVTQKDADRLQLREIAERVQGDGNRGSPVTPANERAAEETKKAAADALKDDKQVDEIIKTGQQSPKVIQTMNAALQDTALETVTKNLSTITAVAIPMCMIVEGSVESSGPLIDANAAAAQRTFLYLGSAAHQQQAGETAAAAVGALNRKLNGDGGVARSNANAMSSGGSVNTDNTLSPYAGALGDFSLINVILGKLFGEGGNSVANTINKGLLPGCDVVASVGFGLVAGAGELVLGFFTGGGEEAAAKAGTAVLSRVIAEYLRGFAAKLVSKQSLKKMVIQGGAIAGAALIAKMIVSNYAGQYYNGLSKDSEFANEIDAGAEANANEVSRAMGGRTLTSEESIATRAASRRENATDQQALSPFERYLALSNPQSLLTRVGYSVMGNANRSFFANLLTSASKIFNPMAIAGLFSRISPSVSAAGQQLDEASYTRTVTAWSEEELEARQTKETYHDPDENEDQLTANPKYQEMVDTYKTCYDDSYGTLFADAKIVREEHGTPDPKQGTCSPQNLGMHNPKYGDLVFRWRIQMATDAAFTIGDDIANPTAD